MYESIFYLDTDVLPIKNLDDAFDLTRGEFLAPADRYFDLSELLNFNAGVMLFRTNSSKMAEFLRMAEDTSKYDAGFYEQGFLNYYYADLKDRLPRYTWLIQGV